MAGFFHTLKKIQDFFPKKKSMSDFSMTFFEREAVGSCGKLEKSRGYKYMNDYFHGLFFNSLFHLLKETVGFFRIVTPQVRLGDLGLL